MAMNNYGADGANLTIFGIPIDDFGMTDPAISISDVQESRSSIKRGLGKTSVRIDSATRPKSLTVNLMPGSEQVRQLIAAAKSGVDATFTFSQSGTNEYVAGFDGVLTKRGEVKRAGNNISDEQFTFEFADSEET